MSDEMFSEQEIDEALANSQPNRREDDIVDVEPEASGGSDRPGSAPLAKKRGEDKGDDKPRNLTAIAVRDGRLDPQNHTELYRMAEMMQGQGIKISGSKSPADTMMALMAGSEIGLGPVATIRSVYIVNGRPTIWGDALVGIAQNTGQYAFHESRVDGDGDDMVAHCTVGRWVPQMVGEPRLVEYSASFSVAQAKTAGLWGDKDVWRKYPNRMLLAKAKTYAFREAFADMLSGFEHEADAPDRAFDPNRMTGGAGSGKGILDAVEGGGDE